jgi:hypothetical protein
VLNFVLDRYKNECVNEHMSHIQRWRTDGNPYPHSLPRTVALVAVIALSGHPIPSLAACEVQESMCVIMFADIQD